MLHRKKGDMLKNINHKNYGTEKLEAARHGKKPKNQEAMFGLAWLLLGVSLHAAGDVEGEEDAHGYEADQGDHQEQGQDVLSLTNKQKMGNVY